MSTTSSTDGPGMRITRRLLAVATVAALAAVVVLAGMVGSTRPCLQTEHAPHAMMSLELAPSTTLADRIVGEWRNRTEPACDAQHLGVARENLARDDRLIVAYVVFGILLSALVGTHRTLPRWLLRASVGAIVLAGACDLLIENPAMRRILDSSAAGVSDVAWARAAAQTKFALLLAAFVVVGTAAVAAVRRWTLRRGGAELERREFASLVQDEMGAIVEASRRTGRADPSVPQAPRGEPRVESLGPDLVGLALSGGGIRSATFNLGLLSGLGRLEVLDKIDYLATVSGGGYLGSFWTFAISASSAGSSRRAAASSRPRRGRRWS
jgi:hypothetical protein